jgi:hypothetical protein
MSELPSNKLKKRIRRWFDIAMSLAAFPFAAFYLFVFPALVASETIPLSAASIAFAAFLFAQFWMLTAVLTYSSASQIYGFRTRVLFKFLVPPSTRRQQAEFGPLGAIVLCVFSYLLTVYGFGIAYAFVSHSDPKAFNAGPLTLFDSVYFSLITAATIGYGDITPVSRAARAFVMAEVLVTLLYAIFLLSMLGGALRDRRESPPPAGN